ncbi:hypothetical protein EV361DRAFT_997987 [Lentinula raphanica]|nr:hypothetical protein EV361DRAFT_997987 [Lentinula raphanica]
MGKRSAAPTGSRATQKRQKKTTRQKTKSVEQSPNSTDDEENTPQKSQQSSGNDENMEDDDEEMGDSGEEVVDSTEDVKAAREATRVQTLKEIAKRKSTVYAFFRAEPEIEFAKDHSAAYLIFQCTNCGDKIRQGSKTGDRASTGNMREHVKKCWGEESLVAVKDSSLEQARAAVKESKKTKQTTLTVVTRKIAFKIIHSTTGLLPKWRDHVAGTQFKGLVLPRDVSTQWNSTYDMLAAFLAMKEPVTEFLDRSRHGLSDFALDDEEWNAIEGLVSVLKVLKEVV